MARTRMLGDLLQGVGRALSGSRNTTTRTTARRPATRTPRTTTRPARTTGVPRSGRGLLRRLLG